MAGYSLLNGVAIRNIASPLIMENLVQNILHINGKGVDERYSTDLKGQQIAIPRTLLGAGGFRKIQNGLNNGGGFNNLDAVEAESDIYYLDITFVYDHIEQLPKIYNDKAGYDLLKSKTENITKKITRAINGLTFANQFVKALNAEAAGKAEFVSYTKGTDKAVDKYLDAQAVLTNGDEAIGVDMFPYENRQFFARTAFANDLKQTGNVILNSNYGQQMLATGVLNPFNDEEASKVNYRTGYFGDVDGVPMMVVSSVIWSLAEQYIANANTSGVVQSGLAKGSLDKVEGILVSALGTLRGIDMSNALEVVPSQKGQGWVLQPLVSGGVACISDKSNVLIVDADFVNPATESNILTILAPENRNFNSEATITGITVAENAATVDSGDATKYTASVANATSSAAIAVTGASTGAVVTGTGTKALEVGANTFKIKVTSQDGLTTVEYTLVVTRAGK